MFMGLMINLKLPEEAIAGIIIRVGTYRDDSHRICVWYALILLMLNRDERIPMQDLNWSIFQKLRVRKW